MKYFSMFSGIGGFELGIGNRGECIGYSEIDKYAIEIYNKHFKHKNYGDATTIIPKQLPDFELLVGGFPCQSFSIAGKRGGFDDTRGTLFFDIARILSHKRPKLVVLENVKGLLSHDGGKTFQTILGVLTDMGYFVEWQVLNSKNFGVPQNRERVFIVGHIRGESRPKVFPIGESSRENIGRGESKNSGTIIALYGKQPTDGTYIKTIPEGTKKGYAEIREGDSVNLAFPKSKTRRGRVGKGVAQTLDVGMQQHTIVRQRPYYENGKRKLKTYRYNISPTITSNVGNGDQKNMVEENTRIRRLTPTECERLQGFPDGWTKGLSDTQRYKCCGNAVTVNVIKAIFDKLI